MSTDLSGKTALITGASRGIGAALAKGLAGAGAHVILLARTQSGLEETDDAIKASGGSATLIPMDLGKFDQVDQLGFSILERFGGLDILVGNAGVLGELTPAHQVKPKDWERVMRLNFTANVRLVRSLDALLRVSAAGRVVFTTSGLADGRMAYTAPYSASKAALNTFAKIYAAETLQTNLKINLVDPGPVDTEMLSTVFPGGYPDDLDVKKPEELVEHYLALVSSECDKHGALIEIK